MPAVLAEAVDRLQADSARQQLPKLPENPEADQGDRPELLVLCRDRLRRRGHLPQPGQGSGPGKANHSRWNSNHHQVLEHDPSIYLVCS